MDAVEYALTRTISIASSTFAFGMIFGWIMALIYLGGSSGSSHRRDDD
jgi:hypothetical protein